MGYYLATWNLRNGDTEKQIIYACSIQDVEQLIIRAYPFADNIYVEDLSV